MGRIFKSCGTGRRPLGLKFHLESAGRSPALVLAPQASAAKRVVTLREAWERRTPIKCLCCGFLVFDSELHWVWGASIFGRALSWKIRGNEAPFRARLGTAAFSLLRPCVPSPHSYPTAPNGIGTDTRKPGERKQVSLKLLRILLLTVKTVELSGTERNY